MLPSARFRQHERRWGAALEEQFRAVQDGVQVVEIGVGWEESASVDAEKSAAPVFAPQRKGVGPMVP